MFRFISILIVSMSILALCCRRGGNDSLSKDELQATNSAGTGIETPDLFTSDRTHVQTHGTIVFKITEDYSDQTREISLSNATTDQTLIQNQKVMAGLFADEGWAMVAGGTEMTVKIFPALADIKAKLRYGENKMHLTAHGESQNRFAEKPVKLSDFAYFGPMFSGPSDNVTPDRPLSGGVSGFVNNVSSNGKSYLFTTTVHVLTH